MTNELIRMEGFNSAGINLYVTEHQEDAIYEIRDNHIVFIYGQAGTGKGYVSIAEGIRALRSKKKHDKTIKKVLYIRPAVTASEDIGFLPGSLEEKTIVFMRPMLTNASKLIGSKRVDEYIKKGKIELQTISHMRGETWENSFVIIDEAQNCTVQQMKMLLTRIGRGSKLVVLGDTDQSDIYRDGLSDAIKRLRDIDGIAFIKFDDSDNMRHPLINSIHKAYKKNIL